MVGVLADFQGHYERAPLRERSFLPVNRDNFDETMRLCNVRLQLRVSDADPASGNERLLDVRFASLNDFTPSSISRQIAMATNACIQSNPLLAAQVAGVLHHPDFLKLEGTWRGLHYLVNHVEASSNLQIQILNFSKRELAFELGCVPELEQSRIYRRIVDDPYQPGAATPFAVVIGDYQFTHDPNDVTILAQMADLAAAACCPFLAAASPTILDLQNWSELPQVRDLTRQTDSTTHSTWNRFRDLDNARYVVLTGPRTLGRPPYTTGTNTGSGGEFDELALAPDSRQAAGHARLCWMNTAFVLGARLCNAFVRHGLCINLTANVDPQDWDFHKLEFEHWHDEARIDGLSQYTVRCDDRTALAVGPLEVGMTGRREWELYQCGLMTLCDNKLATAFHSTPTCHRFRRYVDPEATIIAAMSANLSYVLFVSRFAHYLKAIYKNMGEGTDLGAVQDHLQNWLCGYMNESSPGSSEILARFPLRGMHLEVRNNPERPCGAQAMLHLHSWLFPCHSKGMFRTIVRLD